MVDVHALLAYTTTKDGEPLVLLCRDNKTTKYISGSLYSYIVCEQSDTDSDIIDTMTREYIKKTLKGWDRPLSNIDRVYKRIERKLRTLKDKGVFSIQFSNHIITFVPIKYQQCKMHYDVTKVALAWVELNELFSHNDVMNIKSYEENFKLPLSLPLVAFFNDITIQRQIVKEFTAISVKYSQLNMRVPTIKRYNDGNHYDHDKIDCNDNTENDYTFETTCNNNKEKGKEKIRNNGTYPGANRIVSNNYNNSVEDEKKVVYTNTSNVHTNNIDNININSEEQQQKTCSYNCRRCKSKLFDNIEIILRNHDINSCTHYELDDESQNIRKTLGKINEHEGKLICYKCSSRIGSYSWSGFRCGCGKFCIPAIMVPQNKVDKKHQLQSNIVNVRLS